MTIRRSIAAACFDTWVRTGLLVWLLLTFSVSAWPAESAVPPLAGAQLVSALREGGLIIYFRHASFCRTTETARLIFGRAEANSAVRGGPASPENSERYAGLRSLLSAPVKPGTDLIIVSHGNPFASVAGTPYLAEGEAAVIRPMEKQGFIILARIKKDEWAALLP